MNNTKLSANITDGPLFKNMLFFSLPLIATAVLQMLYSAADMMILGIFDSSLSVGAVGATTSINHLIINLFIGLSAGTTVTAAQFFGAKREKDVTETVYTSMACGLLFGVIVTLMGILLSRPSLTLMNIDENIIDDSVLYMRLVFLGMTPNLIYNYGAAILRACGDSKRPLIILSSTGLANVVLNFIFVYFFHMGVAGVAVSTALSQLMSGIMVLYYLLKAKDCTKISLNKIRFYKDKFIKIISVGIPAGIQGCLFSVSNVIIQSSINEFGAYATSGNAAATNIDSLLTTTLNAVHHTALTFISQNFGAKNYKKLNKILLYSAIIIITLGASFGYLSYLFDDELLYIFLKNDTAAIEFGKVRVFYLALFSAIAGLMDLTSGCLRGIGASLQSMIIHLIGVCGFRLIWIFTIYAANPTKEILYVSYPITWTLTFLSELICYFIMKKRIIKRVNELEEASLKWEALKNGNNVNKQ